MKNKPTRAQLKSEIEYLKAQLIHNYHFADFQIQKLTQDRFLGSAVILQIKALNGEVLISPIALKDGLSDSTISALREQFRDSYLQKIELKPSNI